MRVLKAAVLTVSLLGLAACSSPPAQWKAYSYPAWGFKVSFKTPPTTTETPSSATSPHSFQAQANQEGVNLVVVAMDSQTQGKSDADTLADLPTEMMESGGTFKGPVADIKLGKVAGKDFIIDRGSEPTEHARVFVVKGRVYQVVTQTPTDSDSTDAAKFLDSFQLTGQ